MRAGVTSTTRMLIVAVAVLLVIGGGVVVIARVDGAPTRQEVVAARGARVMPFDLDQTTHRFTPSPTGGIQSVVADDPRDHSQVVLVRRHLRAEADRFRRGDFGDPATIHGHDMPGLRTLRARSDRLRIEFSTLPAGGRLTYRSRDPAVVGAVRDWFRAQLADHGAHTTSD